MFLIERYPLYKCILGAPSPVLSPGVDTSTSASPEARIVKSRNESRLQEPIEDKDNNPFISGSNASSLTLRRGMLADFDHACQVSPNGMEELPTEQILQLRMRTVSPGLCKILFN